MLMHDAGKSSVVELCMDDGAPDLCELSPGAPVLASTIKAAIAPDHSNTNSLISSSLRRPYDFEAYILSLL